MALSKDLLDILACPKCKGPVRIDEAGTSILCGACSLRYRVVDDIPVMLVDEATPVKGGE